jgi:hypothetical protein
MSEGLAARIVRAFRVPVRWDRAVARVVAGRFAEALSLLEGMDSRGSFSVYKQIMLGHCHWQLRNYDTAQEHFQEAMSLMSHNIGISETDRKYLAVFIASHSTPQLDVGREGVSRDLLRWFSIRA